jgi:hypothetical protein
MNDKKKSWLNEGLCDHWSIGVHHVSSSSLNARSSSEIGDHHGQPLMILLGISNNVVTFHNLPHRSTGAIHTIEPTLPPGI